MNDKTFRPNTKRDKNGMPILPDGWDRKAKDDLLKDISIPDKDPKSVFKAPNTEDSTYQKDNGVIERMGRKGFDLFTIHVRQERDWTKTPFTYKWNSLGLRGPEPDYDATTKILFAGGSTALGCGVPLEDSYPYLIAKSLNASYINLSDTDSIDELVELLPQFTDFNPNYVIIGDTRFIQFYNWALADIYRAKHFESTMSHKRIFRKSDERFLMSFDGFVKSLFPNSKLYFARCVRRAFAEIPPLTYMKDITFEKELVVDLARDNKHPGTESHKNFAERVLNCL
jgi:hypothetical protein